MKRVLLAGVVGWVLIGGLYQPSAYAGVTDWPGLKQVLAVGRCLLADAGKIGMSASTHVAGFATETMVILRDCVNFILETGTTFDGTTPTHQ